MVIAIAGGICLKRHATQVSMSSSRCQHNGITSFCSEHIVSSTLFWCHVILVGRK
jgi:hypothetical protein